MRTIKFRGKRVNGGEWVKSMTISNGTIKRKAYEVFFEISPNKWVGVIPETVGQFIGLLDKNDKEIYEGDIVRYIGNDAGDPFTDEVKYNGAGFDPVCAIYWISDIDEAGCEVIGNIHNNPELLKGGSK